MPTCTARYDVILSDGIGSWNGGRPDTEAVVDFEEERLPDEFGEPGKLISARLVGYSSSTGRVIRYGPVGARNRNMLWVDGCPSRARAKHCRWVRWVEE